MSLVKKILMSFILMSNAFGLSILSDFDETIKITQSGRKPVDVFGSHLFSGMTEFLQEMRKQGEKLYILSASPHLLRNHISSLLTPLSPQKIILRKNVLRNKFSFKKEKILQILESSSDQFIFLGDDLGQDPEVYHHIEKMFPERILAIYIRVVKGRTLPEGVTPFLTSFDLALREYENQRLDQFGVNSIFNHLVSENKMSSIFPYRVVCPYGQQASEVWDWHQETDFSDKAHLLRSKFEEYCQRAFSGKKKHSYTK